MPWKISTMKPPAVKCEWFDAFDSNRVAQIRRKCAESASSVKPELEIPNLDFPNSCQALCLNPARRKEKQRDKVITLKNQSIESVIK